MPDQAGGPRLELCGRVIAYGRPTFFGVVGVLEEADGPLRRGWAGLCQRPGGDPDRPPRRIIADLHSTHAGIVKMKAFGRREAWWPVFVADVERVAAECVKCQETAACPPRESKEWWTPEGP